MEAEEEYMEEAKSNVTCDVTDVLTKMKTYPNSVFWGPRSRKFYPYSHARGRARASYHHTKFCYVVRFEGACALTLKSCLWDGVFPTPWRGRQDMATYCHIYPGKSEQYTQSDVRVALPIGMGWWVAV